MQRLSEKGRAWFVSIKGAQRLVALDMDGSLECDLVYAARSFEMSIVMSRNARKHDCPLGFFFLLSCAFRGEGDWGSEKYKMRMMMISKVGQRNSTNTNATNIF